MISSETATAINIFYGDGATAHYGFSFRDRIPGNRGEHHQRFFCDLSGDLARRAYCRLHSHDRHDSDRRVPILLTTEPGKSIPKRELSNQQTTGASVKPAYSRLSVDAGRDRNARGPSHPIGVRSDGVQGSQSESFRGKHDVFPGELRGVSPSAGTFTTGSGSSFGPNGKASGDIAGGAGYSKPIGWFF